MLHPDLAIRKSPLSGKGLFAKKTIPKGTIVWKLEGEPARIYTENQYKKFAKRYKKILNKYAYKDNYGKIIYLLCNSKFWNHSCDPNATPINNKLDMDIAIKDIKPTQEITYDYAFLLLDSQKIQKCKCKSKNCRVLIKREPQNSRIINRLSKLAREASRQLNKVKQPLLKP